MLLLGYSLVRPEPQRAVIQLVGTAQAELGRIGTAAATDRPVGVSFHASPIPVPGPMAESIAEPVEEPTGRPEPMVRQPTTPRTNATVRTAQPTRSPTTQRVHTMTKTEFDRRNGTPAVTSRSSAAVTTSATRIDGSRIASALRDEAASARDARETDGATSGHYIEVLEAALGAELERVGGFTPGVSAEVEFHIMSDGRLARARLVRLSGDDAFDTAVTRTVEAFVAPPRPSGVEEVHRTTFTTRQR